MVLRGELDAAALHAEEVMGEMQRERSLLTKKSVPMPPFVLTLLSDLMYVYVFVCLSGWVMQRIRWLR